MLRYSSSSDFVFLSISSLLSSFAAGGTTAVVGGGRSVFGGPSWLRLLSRLSFRDVLGVVRLEPPGPARFLQSGDR